MPRYVILHHETPPDGDRVSHWDLMLEMGDVLRTWALDRPPTVNDRVPATALADHRKAYLVYEGEISGGRGVVRRWDAGDYQIGFQSEDSLTLSCQGTRLNGQLSLFQEEDHWVVVFEGIAADSVS